MLSALDQGRFWFSLQWGGMGSECIEPPYQHGTVRTTQVAPALPGGVSLPHGKTMIMTNTIFYTGLHVAHVNKVRIPSRFEIYVRTIYTGCNTEIDLATILVMQSKTASF